VTATLTFAAGGTADVTAGLTGVWDERLTIHGEDGELEFAPPAFTASAGPAQLRLTTSGSRTDGGYGAAARDYPPVNPYGLIL